MIKKVNNLIGCSALALVAVVNANAQWDFEYSYPHIFAVTADDYVFNTTNIQALDDGQNRYFVPIQNGIEAKITYHFAFTNTVTDAYLYSHIATYNFGGGNFGAGSLWGSTDNTNWTLLMDAPTPSRIDAGYFYDQHLPISLLGDDDIYIQARLVANGSRVMAQFSRTDNTVPVQIFQFKADVVPEPEMLSMVAAGSLFLLSRFRKGKRASGLEK